jgi:8-oxo-dGTP diphosphatase
MSAILMTPYRRYDTKGIDRLCNRQRDDYNLFVSKNIFRVAVDLVVLTLYQRTLLVLTIKRRIAPFQNRLALPGGFVLPNEDLPEAAARELKEETGLSDFHIEQLASYGKPNRDPRGRVVTIAYLALISTVPDPVAGSDAANAHWMPVTELLDKPNKLAFDHSQILTDALKRVRSKLEYSPIGTEFCEPTFTINELRQVYETVWECQLDPRNFHRKITSTPELLESTGEYTTRQGGRPAALYRKGNAHLLHPPILREEHIKA